MCLWASECLPRCTKPFTRGRGFSDRLDRLSQGSERIEGLSVSIIKGVTQVQCNKERDAADLQGGRCTRGGSGFQLCLTLLFSSPSRLPHAPVRGAGQPLAKSLALLIHQTLHSYIDSACLIFVSAEHEKPFPAHRLCAWPWTRSPGFATHRHSCPPDLDLSVST